MSVEFSVEHGLATGWDEPRISALVASILARERPEQPATVVALHLVSDASIQALNAAHRGKDVPTDVLSFPLNGPDFVLPPGHPKHLGDVVVSYPRALAQADEYGHAIDREIGYLVAHGVLHLLGYDHEKPVERELMRAREEEALRPLGLAR